MISNTAAEEPQRQILVTLVSSINFFDCVNSLLTTEFSLCQNPVIFFTPQVSKGEASKENFICILGDESYFCCELYQTVPRWKTYQNLESREKHFTLGLAFWLFLGKF